ncbi:protein TonB [Saonia flava]|uniref:Protein TonB n=1 Tax=Saonia flava TaxID=523696 RepID=A0A846R0F6_9FLAO|nr:energy transducer TonB [Saonia flava]NJB70854.1 protein TonB [Saonia flava]
MKPKKNPKKDLNKNRGLYFIAGLALVMLLAYVALEWKTYEKNSIYIGSIDVPDDNIEEEPAIFQLKTPPPPQPIAPPVIEVVDDEKDVIEDEIISSETNQEEEVVKVEDIIVEDIDIVEEVDFIRIEEAPIFPGCEKASDKKACFQEKMKEHIRKNFRYPEPAQEMGIQGRVSTMFVIQKDGSISDIRFRGPDPLLEKEAQRIIGKLPKMTPGKQQNKSVRVSFVQPIIFKLN